MGNTAQVIKYSDGTEITYSAMTSVNPPTENRGFEIIRNDGYKDTDKKMDTNMPDLSQTSYNEALKSLLAASSEADCYLYGKLCNELLAEWHKEYLKSFGEKRQNAVGR
jgi:hypothetical protein